MSAATNTPLAVILGAGRAVWGGLPSAVVDIPEHGRVLDWTLAALSVLEDVEVRFVGGYRAEEVLQRYPDVQIVLNPEWQHSGPAGSLALAGLDATRPTYVAYSDVILRPASVAALRDTPGQVVVAVDSHWRSRYSERSAEDLAHAEKVLVGDAGVERIGRELTTDDATAELAGIVRFDPDALELVVPALADGRLAAKATLPDIVAFCLDAGLKVGAVDLEGDWAELDAKQDLARFILGTKAESLERLRPMDHGGVIGAQVSFTAERWATEPKAITDQILDQLPGERLIVRSSARSEDGWLESGAGRYTSILDVERTTPALTEAISDVLASYGTAADDDQVLVQEMLTNVVMSGVVMTRTHATGAPYYVINYDDSSQDTDAVTAGRDVRTLVVHRSGETPAGVPATLAGVLDTVRRIEGLIGHDSLDIEFAVCGDKTHVLQARPIVMAHGPAAVADGDVDEVIAQTKKALLERGAPGPTILGASPRFSVMSDWNPAEIIGTTPKQLAASLYRYLVTDEVWAQQRAEYGYRDVRPCALLFDVAGHPYVDVRASFNSFIPAALPDELAERLVESYLAQLEAKPELHDKVEFDILLTCLTPDFATSSQRLLDSGLSAEEIGALKDALREITAAGIARVDDDLAVLPELTATIDGIEASELTPLERAAAQLDAARRTGTPVFAHLARAGFVAASLLRSLVATGALPADEADRFLASVETVLGSLRSDAWAVKQGSLSWDELVARYGHLRPGTYDITSPWYAGAAEEYLGPIVERASEPPAPTKFEWQPQSAAAITAALADLGLAVDADDFDHFARAAISGREEGKFVFTRALSLALESIADYGASLQIGRDELAHVAVEDLLRCREVLADPRDFLLSRSDEGVELHLLSQAVCLPGQLSAGSDVSCFEQDEAEPNFVTNGAVQAEVVVAPESPSVDVAGKLVLIPTADPGYDWMLARNIAGLITMYGGANSHMAVRAAELGLPAAIGVGETRFNALASATVVSLDCSSRTIEILG
ncbi:MAG: sugar metabolism cluster protein [Actinobacteria bacterium]|nr:sugar metabolism cluster protein [Actinomycetota bacterium]